jgi:hypothetical protein
MDKQTLMEIEATTCADCNKYSCYNDKNELVEQWEKDANGNWKNVTDDRLREIEMYALREEMKQLAKDLGCSEEQLVTILTERPTQRNE